MHIFSHRTLKDSKYYCFNSLGYGQNKISYVLFSYKVEEVDVLNRTF